MCVRELVAIRLVISLPFNIGNDIKVLTRLNFYKLDNNDNSYESSIICSLLSDELSFIDHIF